MKKSTISIRDLVLVALFAALTVIATSIRVPMPAAIGNPFVHLGNSVLLLAVLLLGYKKGAAAGGIGFAIFDILNGYALEAPYFIFESFLVGGAAILAFHALIKNDKPSMRIVGVGLAAGIVKLVLTFLKNTVVAFLAGNSFSQAPFVAITALPTSFVNVVTTIVVVSLLYYPLNYAFQAVNKHTSLSN